MTNTGTVERRTTRPARTTAATDRAHRRPDRGRTRRTKPAAKRPEH